MGAGIQSKAPILRPGSVHIDKTVDHGLLLVWEEAIVLVREVGLLLQTFWRWRFDMSLAAVEGDIRGPHTVRRRVQEFPVEHEPSEKLVVEL